MVGHSLALLLLSVLYHCLQLGSLNVSDQVRAGTVPVRGEGHCPGRRAASSICMTMIDTSQTLPLAVIGCVYPGPADSCKSN